MPVPMTVALPLWNMGEIAWLCLESLCRQRGAPEWELVVAEEAEPNPFGPDRFAPYLERLRDAGMVRFEYQPLDGWITLLRKWSLLSQMATTGSRVFLLTAGDAWNHPERLRVTSEAMKGSQDTDWVRAPSSGLYDIHTDRAILWTIERHLPWGFNMALRTSRLRRLPPKDGARGVDAKLFNLIKPRRSEWFTYSDPHLCSYTRGFNTISRGDPFTSHPPIKPESMYPPEILARLRGMACADNKVDRWMVDRMTDVPKRTTTTIRRTIRRSKRTRKYRGRG